MSNHPKINLSLLEEISGGNKAFVAEMLKAFTESVPEYLAELNSAQENKDIQQVKFYVHKLKSPINLIGVSSVDNAFSFVENFNGNQLTTILPMVEKIKKVANQLLETVNQLNNNKK